MMRQQLVFLALSGLACAGSLIAAERSFGEPLAADLEITPIADLVAEPEAWKGRRVRIEGEVSGVCALKGCWLELVSPQDVSLRVKVDDGVIVFPPDAVGRQAVAEGEVEILELTRKRYVAWLEHQAEETGERFDPAAVGVGPYRIVRLRGLGARITGP